jgi:tetratricopeptide (TPR) repeat protein
MSVPADGPRARRLLRCDHCEVAGWVGIRGDRREVWCESCQSPAALPLEVRAASCPRCGEPLNLGDPRFEEIYGRLQNLLAVLETWSGDPARLTPLVPERPRFLSDLDPPPAAPTDSHDVAAALAALHAGSFAEAGDRLAADPGTTGDERLALALAIARQRQGDLAGAEEAFGRVLTRDPDHEVARLDRGALRARRGDFDGAREDLERAGARLESRWNRAALRVLESVVLGTGLPEGTVLAAARGEAGPPSSYWSDHTVGRLLFTVLVERALARGADACGDARVLRAAEGELEFDTFDDRALVLLGYARLGLDEEVERVAAPLAASLIADLAAEPFARGMAGAFLARALEEASRGVGERRPEQARAAIAPLLSRGDLPRYRIPCARCGLGTIGVEEVEDPRDPT